MTAITTPAPPDTLALFADSIVCEYPCAPDQMSCEQVNAVFDVLYLAGHVEDADDFQGMHLYDDDECAAQHPGQPTAGLTLTDALSNLARVALHDGWPSYALTCSEADTFVLMLRDNGHRDAALSVLSDHPDVTDCRHEDVDDLAAYLDALTPESAAAPNSL